MKLTFDHIIIFIIVTSLLGLYIKQYRQQKFEDSIRYENFTNYEIKDTLISVYDSFYSKIYDKLFGSDVKNEFELYNIFKYSVKDDQDFEKSNVKILDLGCGTGNHLKIMEREHYDCVGVDKSIKMLKVARNVNPTCPLIKGDFLNKSTFQLNEFTHIFCFFFTIYYSPYAEKIFNNVNYWLKPGGYFCVHLVDKNKFDPVLEKASKLIPLYNPQKKSECGKKGHKHGKDCHKQGDDRVMETKLKFNKFSYISNWRFGKNKVEFIENFLFDDDSKHRQNKHRLYMKNIDYYKKIAKKTGFKLVKIIDLLPVNHDYNYIYVFKKIYGE